MKKLIMFIKSKIEILKEKWFWFTHPTLAQQCDDAEEIAMWREFLQTDEGKELFKDNPEGYEEAKRFLGIR